MKGITRRSMMQGGAALVAGGLLGLPSKERELRWAATCIHAEIFGSVQFPAFAFARSEKVFGLSIHGAKGAPRPKPIEILFPFADIQNALDGWWTTCVADVRSESGKRERLPLSIVSDEKAITFLAEDGVVFWCSLEGMRSMS